jgi:hypothetical protein
MRSAPALFLNNENILEIWTCRALTRAPNKIYLPGLAPELGDGSRLAGNKLKANLENGAHCRMVGWAFWCRSMRSAPALFLNNENILEIWICRALTRAPNEIYQLSSV